MAERLKGAKVWKLLALLTVTLSLLIIGTAVYYYYRVPVPRQYAPITGKTINLSSTSQAELSSFMKREEVIIAVSVVSVNLTKNELKVLFFDTEDPVMKRTWEEYVAQGVPVTPAFSNIPKTNVHLANILNGDFSCIPFETSYAGIQEISPWVCSMTIPPGLYEGGNIIGFINFHITRELTEVERTKFAAAAAALSISIYRRDARNEVEKKQ